VKRPKPIAERPETVAGQQIMVKVYPPKPQEETAHIMAVRDDSGTGYQRFRRTELARMGR
jgi:hypothetical protein